MTCRDDCGSGHACLDPPVGDLKRFRHMGRCAESCLLSLSGKLIPVHSSVFQVGPGIFISQEACLHEILHGQFFITG